jgi:hypothetical protein
LDEFWNNFLKGTLGVNATLFIIVAFHLGKLYSRMEGISKDLSEIKMDLREDLKEVKEVTANIQDRCIMLHTVPYNED